MEVARQQALGHADDSLGSEPFTIGLWVGNKVTPGTTADSHLAIQRIRDPERSNAGIVSPGQLTSCPWCGSDVSDGRDIEVDKTNLRTKIYCGDKKGRCEVLERKIEQEGASRLAGSRGRRGDLPPSADHDHRDRRQVRDDGMAWLKLGPCSGVRRPNARVTAFCGQTRAAQETIANSGIWRRREFELSA